MQIQVEVLLCIITTSVILNAQIGIENLNRSHLLLPTVYHKKDFSFNLYFILN